MKLLNILFLILLNLSCFGQTWRVLPSSPTSTSFRHDDIYFLNEDTGWVCNVDGKIYKTTNSGATWATLINKPNTSFRCIGFANGQRGWAGNLGVGRWSPTIDTMPLYETKDGGNTWQPIINISGPIPTGICGINVVNDSVIYAVGRVGGPAFLLKTSNAGASWKSIDMNSMASQLIDCKFFSPDTGFVIGSYTSVDSLSSYRILHTTNGGLTWQTVSDGFKTGLNCWKIFFVNRKIGYASIESNLKSDSVFYLKTIDGGLTWIENSYFKSNSYGGQGIGFINDSIGWCAFLSGDTKQTLDGGHTWTDANAILNSLNRIRVINSNLAFAVGNKVWKFSLYPTGIGEEEGKNPIGLTINSFPNPFVDKVTLNYQIPYPGNVKMRLYDFSGRPIKTFYDAYDSAGEHQYNLNLSYYFDTHFYIVLEFNQYHITQKIISKK